MLSTQLVFLIGALLCALTFFVLYGLAASRVAGADCVRWAALLGAAGNLLYAFGRALPPLLAYEAANAVYAAATAVLVAGFRLLFRRSVHAKGLSASVLVLAVLVAYFHYVHDSFFGRSVVVSLYQVMAMGVIGHTLLRARRQWHKPYYVKAFILAVCLLTAAGHLGRIGWQYVAPGPINPTSLLQPAPSSIFFLGAFCVSLPALAFGGLLLVHRRIVATVEEAANRDFLTGALSRRAFFKLGEREVAVAGRTHRPLALLLIDFDNFKPINDKLGHEAGDKALIAFVRRAESVLRTTDFLGRVGGDEFAVLMPEADLAAAANAGERLKKRIEATREGDPLAGVTLSIGAALWQERDSLKELMKRADTALYRAKANGRNCVMTESALAN
ncbi:hypothetical protein GCM10027321_37360 [Massilia terrae]|uniref:diguanylate cyclase n=1 Tax=Massilia terrae TaxID=1811224 RepID=A0ABT2D1T5_9BURK|nr:GGDEF domain-containing protein [Massilia terrae]MCS0659318.1 GGDEF domain-containing protein [Massilia terrae]